MTSDVYVPTREDKFSFGIWTVGWQGVDVFGGAVRPPMAADRAVRKLAELGAYGVNFHDNDVFDFDATPAERDERIGAFRKALDETGLVVTTATTNLFAQPMFKDGAFTANERVGPAVRAVQGDAQPGPGGRARARRPMSSGAAARAPSPGRPRTSGSRSTGTPRG